MQQENRTRLFLEALMLQARAWQAQRDMPRALAVLEQVLTLAEPEGYVRLFVDEGAAMESLIADFRSQVEKRRRGTTDWEKKRRFSNYARGLLGAFNSRQAGTPKSKITNLKDEILQEPLSAREAQVLQLLAAGLSNKAIARKMCFSHFSCRIAVA
jgi:LuxR family maltose regulon positive regulatory protein